jgi:hypothetical protein
MIDGAVRAKPDAAYDYAELFSPDGSAQTATPTSGAGPQSTGPSSPSADPDQ